ncbi:MAG: hypothetical protein DRJ96_08340 [Thermoprotei archaeon]|nr:MAG: hypothetical protein DRJ67_09565 [Thermoprotei archaeon]RLE95568.1 MAG: hypothetical protein DRJ96_08340 [Thermoprotei archaeon]
MGDAGLLEEPVVRVRFEEADPFNRRLGLEGHVLVTCQCSRRRCVRVFEVVRPSATPKYLVLVARHRLGVEVLGVARGRRGILAVAKKVAPSFLCYLARGEGE